MSGVDDEPAFPVTTIDGFTQHGMTLRDWFAGQALTSPILCNGEAEEWKLNEWFGRGCVGSRPAEIVARQAFEYADAMLEARSASDAQP